MIVNNKQGWNRFSFAAIVVLITIQLPAQSIEMTKEQRSLIDAEQSFAATALSQNIKTAFSQVLDETAVVFRPQPINGRWAYYIDARPDSAYLFWKPEFVDVSIGGDFGYSTGPWYARRNKNTTEGRKGFGNFVTIWKKDKSGAWKILLDKGIGYSAAGERQTGLAVLPIDKKISPMKIDIASIMAIDSKSFAGNELAHYTNSTLLLQNGKWPFHPGNDSLTAEYKDYDSWEPLNGSVAPYGDMAFTYGRFNGFINGKKQEGYYLRIWKRNDKAEWNIVLDLRTEN
ncbi:MAG: DUF4440 domain-containing protein [Chitinophagaceae bacterium]